MKKSTGLTDVEFQPEGLLDDLVKNRCGAWFLSARWVCIGYIVTWLVAAPVFELDVRPNQASVSTFVFSWRLTPATRIEECSVVRWSAIVGRGAGERQPEESTITTRVEPREPRFLGGLVNW